MIALLMTDPTQELSYPHTFVKKYQEDNTRLVASKQSRLAGLGPPLATPLPTYVTDLAKIYHTTK